MTPPGSLPASESAVPQPEKTQEQWTESKDALSGILRDKTINSKALGDALTKYLNEDGSLAARDIAGLRDETLLICIDAKLTTEQLQAIKNSFADTEERVIELWQQAGLISTGAVMQAMRAGMARKQEIQAAATAQEAGAAPERQAMDLGSLRDELGAVRRQMFKAADRKKSSGSWQDKEAYRNAVQRYNYLNGEHERLTELHEGVPGGYRYAHYLAATGQPLHRDGSNASKMQARAERMDAADRQRSSDARAKQERFAWWDANRGNTMVANDGVRHLRMIHGLKEEGLLGNTGDRTTQMIANIGRGDGGGNSVTGKDAEFYREEGGYDPGQFSRGRGIGSGGFGPEDSYNGSLYTPYGSRGEMKKYIITQGWIRSQYLQDYLEPGGLIEQLDSGALDRQFGDADKYPEYRDLRRTLRHELALAEAQPLKDQVFNYYSALKNFDQHMGALRQRAHYKGSQDMLREQAGGRVLHQVTVGSSGRSFDGSQHLDIKIPGELLGLSKDQVVSYFAAYGEGNWDSRNVPETVEFLHKAGIIVEQHRMPKRDWERQGAIESVTVKFTKPGFFTLNGNPVSVGVKEEADNFRRAFDAWREAGYLRGEEPPKALTGRPIEELLDATDPYQRETLRRLELSARIRGAPRDEAVKIRTEHLMEKYRGAFAAWRESGYLKGEELPRKSDGKSAEALLDPKNPDDQETLRKLEVSKKIRAASAEEAKKFVAEEKEHLRTKALLKDAAKYRNDTDALLANSAALPAEKLETIDKEIAWLRKQNMDPYRVQSLETRRSGILEDVGSIDVKGMLRELWLIQSSSKEHIARALARCRETENILRKYLSDPEQNSLLKEFVREYRTLQEWEQKHDAALARAERIATQTFRKPQEQEALRGARIVIVGEGESARGYWILGDIDVIAVHADATDDVMRATIAGAIEKLIQKYAIPVPSPSPSPTPTPSPSPASQPAPSPPSAPNTLPSLSDTVRQVDALDTDTFISTLAQDYDQSAVKGDRLLMDRLASVRLAWVPTNVLENIVGGTVDGSSERENRLVQFKAMIARNLSFKNAQATRENVVRESSATLERRHALRDVALFRKRRVLYAVHNEKLLETYAHGDPDRFGKKKNREAIRKQQAGGHGTLEFIRPADTPEAAEEAKQKILASIVSQEPPLTFFFEGHGMPNDISLGDVSIQASELAQALNMRFNKWKDRTRNDIVILGCCHNVEFARNIRSQLDRSMQGPIFITESEYGLRGISDYSNEYTDTFAETTLGLRQGTAAQPSTLGTVFDHEFDAGMETNPSVYINRSDMPATMQQISAQEPNRGGRQQT